jgi:hypothetical protein
MGELVDTVTLTKKQVEDLFGMLKKDGFHIEETKDGRFKVYSLEKVCWRFRVVTKREIENGGGGGKPRIELWRYESNGLHHVNKNKMFRQCFIWM